MKKSYTFRAFFVLLFCYAFAGLNSTNAQLVRKNVVIEEGKPTVFLCMEQESPKVYLLQLVNNTIWTIKFNAIKNVGSVQSLKLTNGSTVGALKSGSISYPIFQLESKESSGLTHQAGGHVSTPNWLPADSYSKFAVLSKNLTGTILYIEFKYEWELIGSAGQESNSPSHRVYFELSNGRRCES